MESECQGRFISSMRDQRCPDFLTPDILRYQDYLRRYKSVEDSWIVKYEHYWEEMKIPINESLQIQR